MKNTIITIIGLFLLWALLAASAFGVIGIEIPFALPLSALVGTLGYLSAILFLATQRRDGIFEKAELQECDKQQRTLRIAFGILLLVMTLCEGAGALYAAWEWLPPMEMTV